MAGRPVAAAPAAKGVSAAAVALTALPHVQRAGVAVGNDDDAAAGGTEAPAAGDTANRHQGSRLHNLLRHLQEQTE